MKLVQACLYARKARESSFYHCGGPVKHVELCVEWGSTNTAGTSMFKVSHIHKV